jgi:hypothetical protein
MGAIEDSVMALFVLRLSQKSRWLRRAALPQRKGCGGDLHCGVGKFRVDYTKDDARVQLGCTGSRCRVEGV